MRFGILSRTYVFIFYLQYIFSAFRDPYSCLDSTIRVVLENLKLSFLVLTLCNILLQTLAKEIREFRSPTDGDTRMFYEIVVAPSYTQKGLEILKGKSKTLRILKAEHTKKGRRSLRQIGGGWLLQDSDDLTPEDLGFRVVTSKVPTLELVDDAQFAWLCCKHVKSNAIVVAKVLLSHRI